MTKHDVGIVLGHGDHDAFRSTNEWPHLLPVYQKYLVFIRGASAPVVLISDTDLLRQYQSQRQDPEVDQIHFVDPEGEPVGVFAKASLDGIAMARLSREEAVALFGGPSDSHVPGAGGVPEAAE